MNLSKFFDEMLNYFQFSGEIEESEVDLDKRGIKLSAPIQYEGEIFQLDGGENRISIDITYTYEEPCSRCLKKTTNTTSTNLEGQLLEGNENDFREDEDTDELENFIFYQDRELDIARYIISEVYLSMPMKTTCKDDCKGLCPRCGTNLNKNECDCEKDFIDPRLAKLKDFFPED